MALPQNYSKFRRIMQNKASELPFKALPIFSIALSLTSMFCSLIGGSTALVKSGEIPPCSSQDHSKFRRSMQNKVSEIAQLWIEIALPQAVVKDVRSNTLK